MRKTRYPLFLIMAASIILIVSAVLASWDDDGTLICNYAGNQFQPVIIPDGMGDFQIVWLDGEFYGSKIDADGNPQWPLAQYGIYLTQMALVLSEKPEAVRDGYGGTYITWADDRAGIGQTDIYIQRINTDGEMFFGGSGAPVCTAANSQVAPKIIHDDSGRCITTWIDGRTPGAFAVYANRIAGDATLLWGSAGVAVSSLGSYCSIVDLVSDGSGGTIMAWQETRAGVNSYLFSQRVDSLGNTLWTQYGVQICSPAGHQYTPMIASDGAGGAIIAWYDDRGTDHDIYAQRINSSGIVQWTTDGVLLCSAAGNQQNEGIVADGNGGAVIACIDLRGGDEDVYSQKVDASGTPLWTTDGVPVAALPGRQHHSSTVSDKAGGVYVTWEDWGMPIVDADIFVQRIDTNGNALFASEGLPVCTATNWQFYPEICADGFGGAVITWEDYRNGTDRDIYAMRVNGNGRTGYYPYPSISSATDIPDDEGGFISLRWTRSPVDTLPNGEITHYSIWRRIDAAAFMNEDSEEAAPGVPLEFDGKATRPALQAGYAWEWLDNVSAHHFETYVYTASSLYDSLGPDPGWQHFMVSAQTADLIVYYDSPVDSGYSADNLAPAQPMGLAGTQIFTREGLRLEWDPNLEPDMNIYSVYRDLTPDFVPGPLNMIDSTSDTLLFDQDWTWRGGYYYKVSATDVHGNESVFAVLYPDAVTGDEPVVTPAATFLAQNFPNPFNPSTTIRFGLKSGGHVSLNIYDAAGRLVRTLLDKALSAGNYEESWNGLDNAGSSSASGVYFFRLSTGNMIETRKMIMLR